MSKIYLLFGERIRKERGKLKITQEQLAKSSSLHRTYITGVESVKINISLKNIKKIAIALKIEPDKLLTE